MAFTYQKVAAILRRAGFQAAKVRGMGIRGMAGLKHVDQAGFKVDRFDENWIEVRHYGMRGTETDADTTAWLDKYQAALDAAGLHTGRLNLTISVYQPKATEEADAK